MVHSRNGSYGLIEIKLGGDKLTEEGAKTLNKLETNRPILIASSHQTKFSFQCVVLKPI